MRRDATRAGRRSDRILSWSVPPGRLRRIRGQRRWTFEVRTSDIPRRIGCRIEIENSEIGGGSLTPRARSAKSTNTLHGRRLSSQQGAQFRPLPVQTASHATEPRLSKLILSIPDSYRTSLFALPGANDHCLREAVAGRMMSAICDHLAQSR
jgi:hypothetical protein